MGRSGLTKGEAMSTQTAKHTPGPWEVQEGAECCFHRGNRYSITLPIDRGITETIAEVWPGSDERDKADALLIAAAPDLLEALETITLYLAEAHAEDKAVDHYGDETCSYCEGIKAAEAAIAKAKGK